MLKTSTELMEEIGRRIRVRRLVLDWSQQEAAVRAGVSFRTWRRLEGEGKASIEDLVKAAIVLRCEECLSGLFPSPAATSLDDLLKRQVRETPKTAKRRAQTRQVQKGQL